jgi:hypothetical protein
MTIISAAATTAGAEAIVTHGTIGTTIADTPGTTIAAIAGRRRRGGKKWAELDPRVGSQAPDGTRRR